jgi:hypothetical protein
LCRFDIKETVIELNSIKIEAFPSHHLDAELEFLYHFLLGELKSLLLSLRPEPGLG